MRYDPYRESESYNADYDSQYEDSYDQNDRGSGYYYYSSHPHSRGGMHRTHADDFT